MALVRRLTRWSLRQLESSLLPVKGSHRKRVLVYSLHVFKFLLFFPISIGLALIAYLGRHRFADKDSSLLAFAKRPHWKHGEPKLPMREVNGVMQPLKIGFSTSDIQDSGPHSPQFAGTNWGNFYEKNKADIGGLEHLPDMLNNPDILISHLKDLGIKNWRTSINLMPKQGAHVDKVYLKKYCDHLKALTDAGIEVMVTLNHFVHPEDFDWRRHDSIQRMADFAEAVADPLYASGIRQIVVSNEQAVFAVQSHVMGVFPPHDKFKVTDAAKVMHNMMLAQLACYKVLKKKHSDFDVGLTHDPIRFRHFHKNHLFWTASEMILCHYLTEIFHGALLRFLQTGYFSLKVPFLCNYSFHVHEFENPMTRPFDFIGLQYYTDPLIRFPHGSVSRIAGERLTSYQYRAYPQGIASALEEMATLGVPIEISETGIDVNINKDKEDKERIEFFDKLFQAVQKAIDHGVNVRSLHFWTKDKSWEWAEGSKVDLSLYDEHGLRGSGLWLKNLIAKSK